MIDGLPSLQDSGDFFQTQSAGPAHADLEAMEQEGPPGPSPADKIADSLAQVMDTTDAAPTTSTNAPGESMLRCQLYCRVLLAGLPTYFSLSGTGQARCNSCLCTKPSDLVCTCNSKFIE